MQTYAKDDWKFYWNNVAEHKLIPRSVAEHKI